MFYGLLPEINHDDDDDDDDRSFRDNFYRPDDPTNSIKAPEPPHCVTI